MLMRHYEIFSITVPNSSAGFRGGPRGPGPGHPTKQGSPTMFMCLAICATCACHLVIFITEESLFVDTIKLSVVQTVVFPGFSMGMSFLWESHGKRPMGWDGTGINCYGMGMRQINMSHGQPWVFHLNIIRYCDEATNTLIVFLKVGQVAESIVNARPSHVERIGLRLYSLLVDLASVLRRFAQVANE